MGKRILITGGAGFTGSQRAPEWLSGQLAEDRVDQASAELPTRGLAV